VGNERNPEQNVEILTDARQVCCGLALMADFFIS
jgi:hypothetical protein